MQRSGGEKNEKCVRHSKGANEGGACYRDGWELMTEAPAEQGEEYGFHSKCTGESLEG